VDSLCRASARRLQAARELATDAIQMGPHRAAGAGGVVRGDRIDDQRVIVDRLPRLFGRVEVALDLR
jgi:hypothetical protein